MKRHIHIMEKHTMRELVSLTMAALLSLSAAHATAATPTPDELVNKAETLLWGKTLYSDFDMTIKTESWERKLSLKVWMDRPSKSLIRVMAPAKDEGISSLRLGSEMWNYIPNIERTIKIPPSLMLQPWLGSDFTNDDLVKESSLVNDYTHKLLGETTTPDGHAYQVELLPHPDAAVVWGRLVYTIRDDYVPLKLEYFDERGTPIRTLTYSDIRAMSGNRTIPTHWEMQPLNKPGKRTIITIKSITYDKPMDDSLFSLRTLNSKR
jgi:outer membrane lipoprotein-sorting protein